MPEAVADHKALDQFVRKIDHLPLLPQVLVRLVQLDDASEDYFDQFALLAREDPTLAVRVVALANSAAFSPASPMVSIKDALVRVGTASVRAMVTSLAVQRVFIPKDANQMSLWRHSVAAGVAAESIAARTAKLGLDPSHAYLVGLLHDIGRFVMFEHAPDALSQVDEHHWDSPEDLVEADIDVFHFTHSELGYHACVHWGLPGDIAEIVRLHHTPLEHDPKRSSLDAMRCCLQVADRIALYVLLREGEAWQDDDELIGVIEDRCIRPVPGAGAVSARVVAADLARMREDAKALLAGLGMA